MQETGVGKCLQFSMEMSVSPHLMLIGRTTNTVLQTVVMTAQAEAGITMFTKSAVLIKVCNSTENVVFIINIIINLITELLWLTFGP